MPILLKWLWAKSKKFKFSINFLFWHFSTCIQYFQHCQPCQLYGVDAHQAGYLQQPVLTTTLHTATRYPPPPSVICTVWHRVNSKSTPNSFRRNLKDVFIYLKILTFSCIQLWIEHWHLCMAGHLKFCLQSL